MELSVYEQFAKLHPKHPKVEFALFRVGESYWKEAPEEIDREQSLTARAIGSYQEMLRRFPSGKFAEDAKKKVTLGEDRIARSKQFVVKFYCKQKVPHACAFRALKLAEEYPSRKEMRRWALAKGADAFDALAKTKDEDPESDKNIYHRSMTSAEMRGRAKELRELSKK